MVTLRPEYSEVFEFTDESFADVERSVRKHFPEQFVGLLLWADEPGSAQRTAIVASLDNQLLYSMDELRAVAEEKPGGATLRIVAPGSCLPWSHSAG
jgi:hypothetical protein